MPHAFTRLSRAWPLLVASAPMLLVACADDTPSPCERFPNAAACRPAKKGTAAGGGTDSTASVYTTPPAAQAAPPPTPTGSAAPKPPPPRKPDGNKPAVPPANRACQDLSRCCQRIQSGIEKAACMAVAVAAKPSTCATAVIGYQLLGCGHAPFSFGSGGSHDDDGDGTPDFVDQEGAADVDVTLDEYCQYYPTDEVCTDIGSGGLASYDSDPCVVDPTGVGCASTPDPFATDPDFGPSPYDPYDPYGGGTDPYDPYGGGGGTDPYDPYGGGGGTDPYDPYGGGGGTDPYDPGGGSDDGSGGFFDP